MARRRAIFAVERAAEVLVEVDADPIEEFVTAEETETETVIAGVIFAEFAGVTKATADFTLASFGDGWCSKCKESNSRGCERGKRDFVLNECC